MTTDHVATEDLDDRQLPTVAAASRQESVPPALLGTNERKGRSEQIRRAIWTYGTLKVYPIAELFALGVQRRPPSWSEPA